jgi:hypothetical protein
MRSCSRVAMRSTAYVGVKLASLLVASAFGSRCHGNRHFRWADNRYGVLRHPAM